MGVHQVTQAQWQAVMGANPSHFKGESNLPVENVSWDECVAFCEALGKKDGKPYRLPTEAEWEYACRAGTTTPFHFGGTITVNQANYDGNYTYGNGKKGVYRQKTTPVGSFPANAWGLFDMHGNVWEWCADWYGPYPEEELKDPQGFVGGDRRVCRGGSWTATQGTAARRTATGTRLPTVATTSACGSASSWTPNYTFIFILLHFSSAARKEIEIWDCFWQFPVGRRPLVRSYRGRDRVIAPRLPWWFVEQQPKELPLGVPQQERACQP